MFEAPATLAASVPAVIERGIEGRFGYRVPVLVRTAEELRDVAGDNPFLGAGADPSSLHVAFLADFPEDGKIARLDPDRSPPDAFKVRGREIFLCCPNGMARTKLTNDYFDSRLATTSTVRNWRTVPGAGGDGRCAMSRGPLVTAARRPVVCRPSHDAPRLTSPSDLR